MGITTRHPLYSDFFEDWQTMRDTYRGDRRIKDRNILYLPFTPGQIADGTKPNQKGWKNYVAYRKRARFPGFVSQAVEALLGIMHHKPPTIELPAQMEELRDRATVKGESLEILLRRINEEQLVVGRTGIFADIPEIAPPNVLPLIAIYNTEDIINWDDGQRDEPVLQNLNLIVLDESEFERVDIFDWENEDKYRVLIVGDARANEPANSGFLYRMGLFDEESEFNEANLIVPNIRGRTLEEIPFVIINSKDIVADPDDPPLLDLANLALTVYRSEADYRQSLFMQSQDTLVRIGVIKGEDDNVRAGAGAIIDVPIGGDAKYIGVNSNGLEEQRRAIENDKAEAGEIGGKLLDTRGGDAESGEALRIRVSARTASLTQIAQSGAEGLQTLLRIMATWIGANPNDVVVQPNLDFADDTLEGRTLVEYMTAKSLGLPLSNESIHRIMQQKDLTEMEFEEEIEKIQQEINLNEETGVGTEEDDNLNDI